MAQLLHLIISLLAVLMKIGVHLSVPIFAIIGFKMGGGNLGQSLMLALVLPVIGFFIVGTIFTQFLYLLLWAVNLFLRDHTLVMDNYSAGVLLYENDRD